MTRHIAFIAIAAVLLVAAWNGSKFLYREIAGPGNLVCVEPVHDFGVTAPGQPVKHKFLVKNIGRRPIRLAAAKPSCSCSVAKLQDEPIPPGQSATITVSVATNDMHGRISSDVLVVAEPPDKEPLKLQVFGSVLAPWAPGVKIVQFEYPPEAARGEKPLAPQVFDIESPRPVAGLALRLEEKSKSPHFDVSVTPKTDQLFTVSVTPRGPLPDEFNQQVVLEPAAGQYSAYRFNVRGRREQPFVVTPSKVFIADVPADQEVVRDLKLQFRQPSDREARIDDAQVVSGEQASSAASVREVRREADGITIRVAVKPSSKEIGREGRETIRVVSHDRRHVLNVPLVYFVSPGRN